MVDQKEFIKKLTDNDVNFFTGVPDSYLNDFCMEILHSMPKEKHVIAANEGNAIALAAGYYFGNGGVPLVYMQNSGMGNAVNPLVSLCDKNVYSVPMVLVIGWRGPGEESHPQHKVQGEITTKLLDDMDIPYVVITEENALEAAEWAANEAKENMCPVALVVNKGILTAKSKIPFKDESYPLSREEAMAVVLSCAPADAIYSATTGRASRELHALRDMRGENHAHDFLNVGSMGHASSVAAGMALACPDRKVICFDRDAAAIMHMGSWTTDGKMQLKNLLHIVLNNGVHESVGGQPSAGRIVDFTGIAKSCGYATVDFPVEDEASLVKAVKELADTDRPGFIDVHIHAGLRPGMPPLKVNHKEIIEELKNELRSEKE